MTNKMTEQKMKIVERKVIEMEKAKDRMTVVAVSGWCAFVITFLMAVGYLRFIH